MAQEFVESNSGTKILIRSWHPEREPRGAVAIVPGFLAHSAYYEWVAERFVAAGLVAYAVDLRGRGNSTGERFFVESFSEYVEDAAMLVALVKSREPGIPVFLLGHSAGGVVACLYAIEHQSGLAGLICESFAYELPAPDVALAVLKGLSHLAPHAHVLKLDPKDFSRDPGAVEAMEKDSLIEDESQPAQTVAAMIHADARLKQEFPLITLPLLILHGSSDKAAKPSGSRHFYEMAGSADKTLKIYEGGFHDLLNDIDKEKVMADILGWIEARLSGEAGALSPENAALMLK